MTLSAAEVRTLVARYHSPLYVFEEDVVRRQCRALRAAVSYPHTTIRYACKALTLAAILKIIRSEGLAIDASSLNEVLRALRAGFTANEILYTGEGASEVVFRELLDRNIAINCSSLDQVRLIGKLAPGSTLSIRFNPGEGHGAHAKVNTGGPHSKHGVYLDQVPLVKQALRDHGLKLTGVHTHIGSGTDLTHWLKIKDITFSIAEQFDDLEFIDLGGGFPVVYDPDVDQSMPLSAWGERLSEAMSAFSREYGKTLRLELEPGRWIVAECGHLLAEVQNIKTTPLHTFAIVNTGFNHNPRPVMYGAFHPIRFVTPTERPAGEKRKYVIAGNLCESGDVFTVRDGGELAPREFAELELGDIMVMGNIGAYSHAMKSEYNSMNLPASVLVASDRTAEVIERRGTLEDLTRREIEAFREGARLSLGE